MRRAMAFEPPYSWFYEKVKNARGRVADVQANRSWDYKQLGHQYEDFTNFNYGAAGQAAGIPDAVLQLGSAVAHGISHRLQALFPTQFANEGHDQLVILRGFIFASRGCNGK